MSTVGFLGAIRRRPDLSFEQFGEHWLNRHRALMLRVAHQGYLTGYVQNLRAPTTVCGLESSLDGSPELWIRDAEALADMYSNRDFLEALNMDTPRFVAMPPTAAQVSRTTVQGRAALPGPDAIKLMIFFRHCSDRANSQLLRDWNECAAPLLMPEGRPNGLTRLTAITSDSLRAPYFGCEVTWWPDPQTLAAAWASRLCLHKASRYELASIEILEAQEHVALAPPAR